MSVVTTKMTLAILPVEVPQFVQLTPFLTRCALPRDSLQRLCDAIVVRQCVFAFRSQVHESSYRADSRDADHVGSFQVAAVESPVSEENIFVSSTGKFVCAISSSSTCFGQIYYRIGRWTHPSVKPSTST